MSLYMGLGQLRSGDEIDVDVRWIGEGNNSASIVNNWLNIHRSAIAARGYSTNSGDYINRQFSLNDAPRPGGAPSPTQAAPAQAAPIYAQPAAAAQQQQSQSQPQYQGGGYQPPEPPASTIFGLPTIAVVGGAGALVLFMMMKGKR